MHINIIYHIEKPKTTNQPTANHPSHIIQHIDRSKRLSFSPPCPRVQSDPVRHPSRILGRVTGEGRQLSVGWLPFKWWLSRKAKWNELKNMVSMAYANVIQLQYIQLIGFVIRSCFIKYLILLLFYRWWSTFLGHQTLTLLPNATLQSI